jgi:hypothetical protein
MPTGGGEAAVAPELGNRTAAEPLSVTEERGYDSSLALYDRQMLGLDY